MTDQPWRSLDELAGTPEFRAFAAKEFPGFANVWEADGMAEGEGFDRRQFLALSAAGLALAGLAGCRRPDLEILPYTKSPDDPADGLPTPGLPSYYATTVPLPGGGFPVLVESHDGRPTKIEGHPDHPASRGATDAFTQAAILDLYNPDRSRTVVRRTEGGDGRTATWAEFDAFALAHFNELRKAGGKGLRFLAEDVSSPALRKVREHLKATLPQAVWHTYEPVGSANATAGTWEAFGQNFQVAYRFDKADVILSLDSDFLSFGGSSVAHQRGFAAKRRVASESDPMNRLYVAESGYTVTGSMADHRLRLPASHVVDYAFALANELLKGKPFVGRRSDFVFPPEWIAAVAADLKGAAGKSVVIAGDRQPTAVHALAHLMNDALGNNGVTVEFRLAAGDTGASLADLAAAIGKNEVASLVILGGNPAQTAPADFDFAALVRSVPASIHLSLFDDETSGQCRWHVPGAHFLESWGDCETADGTYSAVQPLIAPLFTTADPVEPAKQVPAVRSVLEFLVHVGNYDKATTFAIARTKVQDLLKATFQERSGVADAAGYRKFLHLGWLPDSARKPVAKPAGAADAVKKLAALKQPKKVAAGNLELAFAPCYRVFDGRHATNAWLQEMPDPITKLVWDNAALLSPKTAGDLSVKTGDLVTLTVPGRPGIEIAAFVLPGHADHSVTVHVGHGRIGESQPLLKKALQGTGGGFDVYPLRTSAGEGFVTGVRVERTGRRYRLVTTQDHGTMAGRDIVRLEKFADFQNHRTLGHEKLRHHAGHESTEPKGARLPLELAQGTDLAETPVFASVNQWGMAIDLNVCTGCSACVVACQSENNIPVVGKDEVRRGREMHWIRLDRYFTGPADDPGLVQQPLACVHCEQAPCETVCPVNAAVHSPEGLNLQVFNRCIGTRYCSNNCPYKARRFNWFDYNRRPLDHLRLGPLVERVVPETLKMQRNPDVTVRMRGVMEKCTYCVQRIERAKIGVKLAETRKGSTNFAVADGLVTPACAQTCPSQAIVFGNVNDPSSRVSKLTRDPDHPNPRNYGLLSELHTRPRTTYLSRLWNPNPAMAEGTEAQS
jgi:molybdopterin-containing oxidoreductase family iron-sulfur binding subunit